MEKLENLLKEYKETERCIELYMDYVEDKDYAQGKLEIVKMIIADLEKVVSTSTRAM